MNNTFKIIGLILLAAAIYFLIFNKPAKNSYSFPERDFAIEDTSQINKIYIADKGDLEILLERDANNIWTVNQQYKVRKKNMEILLETIKNIKVQYPVPNAAHNNVIKNLASKGKKIEIYLKNSRKPYKVYYIGSTPPGNIGNYALLDGAEKTFVVNVPGFQGYISNRYILDIEQWRSRMAFSQRAENIKSINIYYPHFPERSFLLTKDDKNQFAIINNINKNAAAKKMNTAAALNYLQAFRNLGVETFANDFTRRDSLLKAKPFAIVELTTNSDDVTQLTAYYVPLNKRSKGQINKEGRQKRYDEDKFYAVLNKEKDIAVIQQYVFGKIFKTYKQLVNY